MWPIDMQEQAPWDGVIRQQVVLYAIIEWGDPTAYGTRTRCSGCEQRGLLLSRHTPYIDPAVARRNKEIIGRTFGFYSQEDRASADAFLQKTTEEQCKGQMFHRVAQPICERCGINTICRFLSMGHRGSRGVEVSVPANGYTALLTHGEPGPNGTWQTCVMSGYGTPDPTALVRSLAGRAYENHPSDFRGDAMNLVGGRQRGGVTW